MSKKKNKRSWVGALKRALAETKKSKIGAEKNRMMKRVMGYSKPPSDDHFVYRPLYAYGQHSLED